MLGLTKKWQLPAAKMRQWCSETTLHKGWAWRMSSLLAAAIAIIFKATFLAYHIKLFSGL
jgi:hypothetical protein